MSETFFGDHLSNVCLPFFLTTDFSTTCNNFLDDFLDNYTPIFLELITPMSSYNTDIFGRFFVYLLHSR